ncbi:hypothetical protein QQ008_07720 [Fulvivirgaceae bacterium BMA10]|uniref:Uncharacterized protein n=1 Tax=Splendidivirga corallicola TaxID=3051826 RepID=A0ABT8KKJ7_9BACT|nr:hypothetical protein [Fulvivirgaceae bacterium BMA10]
MATTNKSTTTKASKGNVSIDSKTIWIGGGIVLLVGSGVAIWYFIKKKKGKEAQNEITTASAASNGRSSVSGRFQCTSTKYPLTFGTCHPDVGILQRYLKSLNMNLGRSGMNRDGVDMQFGALTKAAALKKLGKDTFQATDIEGIKKALNFVGS